MKKILLPIFLTFSFNSFGQTCKCDSLFLQMKQLVEENYAGWFDKIKPENKGAYTQWSENKLREVNGITNDSSCAKKLQEWISFFGDKHLRILFTKPKQINAATKTETSEIKILTHPLSEEEAISYFKNNKSPDPVEGIYTHPVYKLAITKIEPNLFYATVLSSQNGNWKPGEVKLTITKKGKEYFGTFYEGDKSDLSNHPVKLVDNILDFDIVYLEKQSPNVKNKLDLTEYEISKDKDAPGLRFKDNVAIWKFPTFYSNSEEQTAFLLNRYKEKLDNTPNWIIDLRDNRGGDYRVGWQLINYIYTRPIIKYHAEQRMTLQNIDMWFNSFVKSYYNQANEKEKKELDDRLDNMKKNVGKMYNETNKLYDSLSIEKTTVFPKKIALLINENTLSSGELFTMLVRQSDKVVVMGSNSGGMMDYGNVLRYKTHYPGIRVQIPMDRMLWLDTGFSVDKEGLKPEIYLKGDNWIEQAIKIIGKE